MTTSRGPQLSIFAPAKVNLYLHVTGRLDNGYHTIDSLVAFADIGDQIEIKPAEEFTFHIKGPYENAFGLKERDASPDSANLVVRAAWGLARAVQKTPDVEITLTKNLPPAAGIGGGSADAAATIWGLLQWWQLPTQMPFLPELAAELGADLPVCLHCQPARIRGIGDNLDTDIALPEIPIVLINPGTACPTAHVFSHYHKPFRDEIDWPDCFAAQTDLIDFLKAQHNDLTDQARIIVPDIDLVLTELEEREGCELARLSGSGATCFGIFRDRGSAQLAAEKLEVLYPQWWVRRGMLNHRMTANLEKSALTSSARFLARGRKIRRKRVAYSARKKL